MYEKIMLSTGGLLATALAFLSEQTVDHLGRALAVMLLFCAAAISAVGWLLTAPDARERTQTVATRLAATIAVLAFAAAVGGYMSKALQAHVSETLTAHGASDVPRAGVRKVSENVGEAVVPLAAAIVFSVVSVAAFAMGHRLVGTVAAAAAVCSFTFGGLKIFEFKNLINELKVSVQARGGDNVADTTITHELVLLSTLSVGPFDTGDAALPPQVVAQFTAARDDVARRGIIAFAVLVGNVDRRALLRDTSDEYASNQGLAMQRAESVRTLLSGVPAVISAGGPRHTRLPVFDWQLEDDRSVDVYLFGQPKR